jgi:hypothetical protein
MQGLWSQLQHYQSVVMQNAPAELVQVLTGGVMSQDRIAQARNLWQSYLVKAKAGDDMSAEYAIMLTGSMTTYFTLQGDPERCRATYETALEALPSPAHKEIMRLRLARAARKAGDVAAAKAWFDGCDPKPSNLEADAEYRLTLASMATYDEDYQKVLEILGPSNTSIPVPVAPSLMIAFFRANALEKTGNLQAAVSNLVEFGRTITGAEPGPHMMMAANANAHFNFCPQSLPMAVAELSGARHAPPAPPMGVPEPAEPKRHGLFGRHKS